MPADAPAALLNVQLVEVGSPAATLRTYSACVICVPGRRQVSRRTNVHPAGAVIVTAWPKRAVTVARSTSPATVPPGRATVSDAVDGEVAVVAPTGAGAAPARDTVSRAAAAAAAASRNAILGETERTGAS